MSDTLSINYFGKYNIYSLENIELLERNWREKNKPKLIEKYGFPYPIHNKNGIFDTYLIEILEEKDLFVIYPVIWRNLGQKQ